MDQFKLVLKVEKKERVSEEELFSKIKEFLDQEKDEFPSIALTSMIMDAFVNGESISKVNKELELSNLEENFEILKEDE
jgi:hypothetical protein